MESLAAVRRNDVPTSLSALGRFKGFKPESERKARTQKVETNPAIEQMKKDWRSCVLVRDVYSFDEGYHHIFEYTIKPRYCAKDIEDFSLALAEFQDEEYFWTKAGLFLAAYINKSDDAEFVIHTAHLAVPIRAIGCMNEKKITIQGDAGFSLGEDMRSGSIIVNGGALDNVGIEMGGGTIIINGNARDSVGRNMISGKIFIEGNAGDYAGDMMTDTISKR